MRGVEMKDSRAIEVEGINNLTKRLFRWYLEEYGGEQQLNLKDIAIAIAQTAPGENICTTIYNYHHEILERVTA